MQDFAKIKAFGKRWGAFLVVVAMSFLNKQAPMGGLFLFWGVVLAAAAIGSVLEIEPGLLVLPILGGCTVWLLLFGKIGRAHV